MDQYIINTTKDVLAYINELLSAQSYVNNKRKRKEFANFCKKVLNLGSSFPEVPKDLKLSSINKMYKDISRTCGQCVRPSIMLETVKNSIRVLNKYKKDLEKSLSIEPKAIKENKSIHSLKPNI